MNIILYKIPRIHTKYIMYIKVYYMLNLILYCVPLTFKYQIARTN